MRETKKQERNLEKIKALLLKHGIDNEVIEEAIAEAPTFQDAVSRQGEAVLLFLEAPAKFTAKLCKRCGEPFSTNYRYVAYCTDTCRAKAISEQTGVKWDWLKPELERWGFKEPPLIIPPGAFKMLGQYVAVLQSQTQNETEPQDKEIETQLLDPQQTQELKNHKTQDNSLAIPQSQPVLKETVYIPPGMDEFFDFS